MMKRFNKSAIFILTAVLSLHTGIISLANDTINLNKPNTAESYIKENSVLKNIPFCELIREIVIQISGEQPMIMDAHYAMPYMQKAYELGIISQEQYSNKELWNDNVKNSIFLQTIEKANELGYSLDLDKINSLVVSEIKVNGTVLESEKSFVRNGKIMLPLRTVAEKLGFKVTWNQEDYTCEIDDGIVKTLVQIGYDRYYKASSKALGLTAPMRFGVSPMLINGVTYVPSELFNLVYSNPEAVKLENNTININKMD